MIHTVFFDLYQLKINKTLQCMIVYESLQQCAVVYDSVKQCTIVYDSIRQCTIVHDSIRQCKIVYDSVESSSNSNLSSLCFTLASLELHCELNHDVVYDRSQRISTLQVLVCSRRRPAAASAAAARFTCAVLLLLLLCLVAVVFTKVAKSEQLCVFQYKNS